MAEQRQKIHIASGQAISETLSYLRSRPRGLGVLVPSVWTAANIGFEVSDDNLNWFPLLDNNGVRVKITNVAIASGGFYVAPPEVWLLGAFAYVRLASLNTSTGANIAQAGARTLWVATVG